MASLYRFQNHLKTAKYGNKDTINNAKATDKTWKILKFISYAICLFFFFTMTFAVFQTFAKGTMIKSTSVLPAPGGYLRSPTVLVCNSSAYKEPVIYTSRDGFKNNTMSMDDFLIDALVVKNASAGVLSFKPSSIKESVKEIATMFHGTCIIVKNEIKVYRSIRLKIHHNGNHIIRKYTHDTFMTISI